MGRMMQTWSGTGQFQRLIDPTNLFREIGGKKTGRIVYEEALLEGLVEVVQVEHFDGIPQMRVTNNSSWSIELFSGKEMVGSERERLLTINIILKHNASVVIPSFFLASTYFFDQGMVSIQEYLQHFRATDNQTGVIYRLNGRISGERCGDFPLLVEVCYSHF
ncbi:MAG: DUF6569 family protein [Pseudomonadota bacterium]